MQIDAAFLNTPEFRKISDLIQANGWRVWVVGGAVRDHLLDRAVGDVDLASDADPHALMTAATEAGLRALPTGIDHGTVTLLASGKPYEVTALRRDVETDGRHAIVAPTTDLAEDAARRDFTMNALYTTPDGEIIDPLGGLEDLRARRLRFVGTPATRIAEDYLRILRFYRFMAQLGLTNPDPAAQQACAEGAEGMSGLSRERIGAEMRKLLAAPDPRPALHAMAQAGVLEQTLPGATLPLPDHPRLSWLGRLAALGGDNPAQALRLSRQEARYLDRLRAYRDRSIREIGYHLSSDQARDAAILSGLTDASGVWLDELKRAAAARLPIRAADLDGLAGPALGRGLRAAEGHWIASGFTASPVDLIKTARTAGDQT